LWVVTRVMQMELLSMILGQIIGVGVIALIVVFQQEIRRFLILLGTQYTNRRVSLFSRLFRPRGRRVTVVGKEWIETVVSACTDMAATKTGALIVIARQVNLLPFIEQGERIDALISAPLIKNVFFKNSPLHDGAMVIADDRIAAVKCVLPSTERDVPMEFGMRHRAALGASEISDALVIVVSEERGTISLARKGHISCDIHPIHLRVLLRKGLAVS
ncbi:MAG: diadenylate cyclase, partial [Alistipes sp.]|nr:diadenylate cyclase [Alistipes sp.]